jgi:hypothetical protein
MRTFSAAVIWHSLIRPRRAAASPDFSQWVSPAAVLALGPETGKRRAAVGPRWRVERRILDVRCGRGAEVLLCRIAQKVAARFR